MLETYEAEEGSMAAESSADKVERDQVLNAIDDEVQKLPATSTGSVSSCVIGRIWTWRKPPRSWDVRRVA